MSILLASYVWHAPFFLALLPLLVPELHLDDTQNNGYRV